MAHALVQWMRRETGSNSFDDAIESALDADEKNLDPGLFDAFIILWSCYDDFSNHVWDSPSIDEWCLLIRVLALLRSDIPDIGIPRCWLSWDFSVIDPEFGPFKSKEIWEQHMVFVADELKWPIPRYITRKQSLELAREFSNPVQEEKPKHRDFRLTRR